MTYQIGPIILMWLTGWTGCAAAEAGWRAFKHKTDDQRTPHAWTFYAVILTINFLLAIIFQGHIKRQIISSYRIPSISMEPTLFTGDLLIADIQYYHKQMPEPGDVVIFYYPEQPDRHQVKRCVAVAGDTVRIGGRQIAVPQGQIFMVGDNLEHSVDSRIRGMVPVENVVAKPLYVYWASDKTRIGKRIL